MPRNVPRFFSLFHLSVFLFPLLLSYTFNCYQSNDPGARENIVTITGDTKISPLNPALFLFEDPGGSTDLNGIIEADNNGAFQKSGLYYPIFWWNSPVVWGRFDLDNSAPPGDLYLYFDFPLIENIDLFFPDETGRYEKLSIGHYTPPGLRPVKDRKLIFPLKPPPGPHRFYFRINSPRFAFDLPLKLVSGVGLLHLLKRDSIIYGAYFGIVVIMLLYNFFIFITTRDRAYLWYVLSLLAFMLNTLASQGFITHLLSTHGFNIHFSINLTAALCVLVVNFFMREFYRLSTSLPVYDKILKAIQVFVVLNFFTQIFSLPLFINLHFLSVFGSSVFGIIIGALLYKKNAYSRHFTHANIVLFIALILFSLRGVGLHINFTGQEAMQAGNIIAILLFSFALGNRISDLKEKNRLYEVMSREIAFAGELQRYLFPQKMPSPGSLRISAKYKPCTTISGDFYDYFIHDDGRISFFIADVSGHGYSAGLIAAMVKVAYHETVYKTATAEEHQNEINRILARHVNNTFVTAINLRIDTARKTIEYVRSGHCPLLIYRKKEHTIEEIDTGALPLAVLGDYQCRQVNLEYQQGDRLYLYTDGLTEEIGVNGEEYGVDRLKELLLQNSEMGPDELCDFIMDDVMRWKSGKELDDDITFVTLCS